MFIFFLFFVEKQTRTLKLHDNYTHVINYLLKFCPYKNSKQLPEIYQFKIKSVKFLKIRKKMLKNWCCIVMLVAILCGVAMCEEDDSAYSVEIDNFEINKEYDQKYIDWDTLGLKQKGRNKFVIQGKFILNLNLGDEQKVCLFKIDLEIIKTFGFAVKYTSFSI